MSRAGTPVAQFQMQSALIAPDEFIDLVARRWGPVLALLGCALAPGDGPSVRFERESVVGQIAYIPGHPGQVEILLALRYRDDEPWLSLTEALAATTCPPEQLAQVHGRRLSEPDEIDHFLRQAADITAEYGTGLLTGPDLLDDAYDIRTEAADAYAAELEADGVFAEQMPVPTGSALPDPDRDGATRLPSGVTRLPSDVGGALTREVGFIEAPARAAAKWMAGGRNPGPGRWVAQPARWKSFSDAVRDLAPAEWHKRRDAFIPLGEGWCVLLNNCARGTDATGIPLPAARDLDCRTIRAVRGEAGEHRYPARMLDVYAPGGELIRSIAAMNDGGRWRFESEGEPFGFEHVDEYQRRLKRERFTGERLEEYLSELGVPVELEPRWDEAWLAALVVSPWELVFRGWQRRREQRRLWRNSQVVTGGELRRIIRRGQWPEHQRSRPDPEERTGSDPE